MRELDFDIATLTAAPETGPRTWKVFVREFLASYDGLAAPATIRKYKHDLGLVTRLAAVDESGNPILTPAGEPVPMVRMTTDLTVMAIARLVMAQPDHLSAPTMLSLLRSVRAAANFAVRNGNLPVSPFTVRPVGKWLRAGKPQGRRHLSRLALAALLGSMKRAAAEAPAGWRSYKSLRIYTMTTVCAYTGLRAGELLHLHVEDVDLATRIISVRPRKTYRLKTASSEAPVPMPKALVPIVSAWLERRCDPPNFPPSDRIPWMWPGARGKSPWVGGCPGTKPLDVLKAAALEAGVGDVNFQMLRRGLTTHLRGAFGVDRDVASRILRHSPEVDDRFYMQDDEDNLRDAVADVEF